MVSIYSGSYSPVGGVWATANYAPTVAVAASAESGAIVVGGSTSLSALGSDDHGEAALRYTWKATTLPVGAKAPIFSVNGVNAAQNTTVTFRKAGVYSFTATITDAAGLSAKSTVSITVNQVFSAVAISPRTGSVVWGVSQQCVATGLDQFGRVMAGSFNYAWSATTLPDGTQAPTFNVNDSTLAKTTTVGFSKAGVYGVTATVTDAQGRSLQSTTNLSVNAAPTRLDITPASGFVIAGTNTVFAASGFDQFGNALTSSSARYTWTATTLPAGATPPTFSVNGVNAAQNTTVTFRKAGVYSFTATITDAAGFSAKSTVSVTVNQVFSGVAISPRTGSVVWGASQQCVATGLDQFGRVMAGSFNYAWSATTLADGAQSPTFSVNDSTLAKTTTVGFSKAGVYGITATVTDAQGRSLQGTTNLSVNAAPTRLDITPASGFVIAGTNTVFVASSFDQFGNALTSSSARYTWTTTTLPARTAAPTFSVNGVNAAQNTTVTFRKAGVYSFTATVTDGVGVSIKNSVTVTVSPTPAGIVLDTTQVELMRNATRQFTARAYDQFRNVLATQPTLAWSAGGGTITAGGLFTAPGEAGTMSVTARCGLVSGTATVTVASGFLNLQDIALGNLVQSLDADGSISRQDMIDILRSTASDDNVVDAAEFSDLKRIVGNAAALNMAGYVQVLVGNVVNGNVANAKYQGQTLGDLTAGSAIGQLNKLVDKWFLGADRPSTGYSYRSAAGSLFVGGPAYTDTRQGYLGDCYFIAALGTIAKSSPVAIQNMFLDNGDNTWTVRLFYNGAADYVTVDRYLPTDSGGSLVYAGVGSNYANAGNELWIPLAEKAYAQWNETGKEGRDGRNAYASIEYGWMSYVDAQVLGRAAANYAFGSSTKQTMIDSLAGNKAITLGTNSSPGNGLYGTHAYMVTAYNSVADTFTLQNPWGFAHPGPLTWTQLQTGCQLFTVADASGTTPLSAARATAVVRTDALPAAWDIDNAASHRNHASAEDARWDPTDVHGAGFAIDELAKVRGAARSADTTANHARFAAWSGESQATATPTGRRAGVATSLAASVVDEIHRLGSRASWSAIRSLSAAEALLASELCG